MEEPRSEFVQHGIHTWVDYSRPWLTRRQFLITDYQAGILTSFVSVAITLAAPRFWILVKALLQWSSSKIFAWRRHKHELSDPKELKGWIGEKGRRPLRGVVEHNLAIITHSHSELAASGTIMRDILRFIKKAWPRHVRFSDAGKSNQNDMIHDRKTGKITQIVADVLFPFLFAALLVAVFVAQSTGAVFSSNIFKDEMAISSGLNCTQFFSPRTTAIDYHSQCYASSSLTPECDSYVNRTLSYTENHNCPLPDGNCSDVVSYNTGVFSARDIGFNTRNPYFIRKQMSCTNIPLTDSDDAAAKQWADQTVDERRQIDNEPPLPSALSSCARSRIAAWELLKERRSCPADNFVFNTTGSITQGNHSVYLHVLKDLCWGSPLENYPKALTYCERGNVSLTYFVCAHQTEYGTSAETMQASPVIIPEQTPDLFLGRDPNNEDDLSQIFLSALLGTNAWPDGVQFLLPDKGNASYGKRVMSPNTWKLQLRQSFEQALAKLQVDPVETVRGPPDWDASRPGLNASIPEDFRGICKLIKFRSRGWRNVSTWGLVGILATAAGVTVASIRTESGRLWVVILLAKLEILFLFVMGLLGSTCVRVIRLCRLPRKKSSVRYC